MNSEDKFEIWETIKSFYVEKFGIAPELVDLASVIDLLKLCAAGASNKSIAGFYNENEEDLEYIFDAHLGFKGWKEDLTFSPLRFYKMLAFPSEEAFVNSVIHEFGYKLNMDLHRMYECARLVERLERLFDEKWI